MNLYQWIVTELDTIKHSDDYFFENQYSKEKNHKDEYAVAKEKFEKDTLSFFLDKAADEYAKAFIYRDDQNHFSEKEFRKHREEFGMVFCKLLKHTPSTDVNEKIYLMGNILDSDGISIGPFSLDIRSVVGEGKEDSMNYALDWRDWDDILGMEVSDEFFEFPADYILGNLLWEISFWGIDNEKGEIDDR